MSQERKRVTPTDLGSERFWKTPNTLDSEGLPELEEDEAREPGPSSEDPGEER